MKLNQLCIMSVACAIKSQEILWSRILFCLFNRLLVRTMIYVIIIYWSLSSLHKFDYRINLSECSQFFFFSVHYNLMICKWFKLLSVG